MYHNFPFSLFVTVARPTFFWKLHVSRDRGERIFPEESFVRTFLFRGKPEGSLHDSQIAFRRGGGGGLSVIDHRENSRSVDLPRPIPLNPRNLKLQKCSFGVVPPLPSPRSGVSRTEKVKSYPDGYTGIADRR